MRRTDPKRGQRGTQIAELAIVLPLLVLLALLVTEGAGLVRAHVALNNVAREAARLASQPENQGLPTAIRTLVLDADPTRGLLLKAGLDPAKAVVVIDQNAPPILADMGGATVSMGASKVTITYTYEDLIYLSKFLPSGTSSVTLKAAAEFRNLY